MDPYYLIGEDEEIELLGELLGEELEEDPILGQRSPLHRRISATRGGMRPRARLRKALVPRTPGVPKPGGREFVLGFPGVQFTNTSALVLQAVSNPQMPFKGRRLVVEVTRSVAGSGGALTINDIKVGQRSQLVNANPIPVGTFAAGSFGVDLALDASTPGVDITIIFGAGAQPGVAETVDIFTSLIGLSLA